MPLNARQIAVRNACQLELDRRLHAVRNDIIDHVDDATAEFDQADYLAIMADLAAHFEVEAHGAPVSA